MEATKTVDLHKQEPMEDFKPHVKPGDRTDYDLHSQGTPRAFGTVEEAAPDREPSLEAERARPKMFSPKAFVVPIRVVKKKLGALVRKLSCHSMRNVDDGGSPRSVSVHTETPITVSKTDHNSTEGAMEGESATPPLSPISDVPLHINETQLDDEEESNDSAPLNDKNLITVLESADDATESKAGGVEYEDRIDNVPRRVRSKLPSEEEPPYIKAGMVSKVIAKLNSASSFEFRQASSFVKKTSLLPLSPIAASGGTKSSTVDRNLVDNACESDAISLTQPSVASAASVESKMFAVSPSGRVDRLCSLFQEKDSPSLFQYGMGSLHGSGHAPCSVAVTTTPLNRMVGEPSTSSFKGSVSASVDNNQLAAGAENPDRESNERKRIRTKEDVVDVGSDNSISFDQPGPCNESANAEETITPQVPRGLSCDSHADSEDNEQSDELKSFDQPREYVAFVRYTQK